MNETIEKLPLWLKTTTVRRRSRWERLMSRVVRPRPARQGVLPFVERARRVDRIFKAAIACLTIGLAATLLAALPSGRYFAGWMAARGRATMRQVVGLEPDRDAINADWRRRREFDMQRRKPGIGGRIPNTTRNSGGCWNSPAWTPITSCCAGGTSTRR